MNRALVSPAFRQRLMPGLVPPLLEPVAHELIDRFEAIGRGRPRGRLHQPLPVHRDHPAARAARATPRPTSSAGRSGCSTSRTATTTQSSARASSWRSSTRSSRSGAPNPGDDLLSTLATAEEEGQRLTDEEIYNFLRLLFPAGADTTYLGLGSTLYSLLTHPDQLDARPRGPRRAMPMGRRGGASGSTRRPRGSRGSTRATWCGTTSRSRPVRRCCSA